MTRAAALPAVHRRGRAMSASGRVRWNRGGRVCLLGGGARVAARVSPRRARRTARPASPRRRSSRRSIPTRRPAARRRACRRCWPSRRTTSANSCRASAAGSAAAAKDRGLDYRVALADNDAARMIEQVQAFLAAKVGAVVAAPVDPPSLSRSLQQVIWAGGYVGTVVPPPATSLLNAPQYLPARCWATRRPPTSTRKLGGKANVVLLTHDSLQFLAPRFVAMRDALKDMPGVDHRRRHLAHDRQQGGRLRDDAARSCWRIPTIDVVLGADTVVLGALAALREAGKARPDQFLGGIDGEPEAVAEIKKGGPLQGEHQPCLAGLRLRHGPARGRLARGQEHPAGDGHPAERADRSTTSPQYEADLADPGGGLCRPGAPRRLSQDVRQHLLRHARPLRELPLVVGAEVTDRSGEPRLLRSNAAIRRTIMKPVGWLLTLLALSTALAILMIFVTPDCHDAKSECEISDAPYIMVWLFAAISAAVSIFLLIFVVGPAELVRYLRQR